MSAYSLLLAFTSGVNTGIIRFFDLLPLGALCILIMLRYGVRPGIRCYLGVAFAHVFQFLVMFYGPYKGAVLWYQLDPFLYILGTYILYKLFKHFDILRQTEGRMIIAREYMGPDTTINPAKKKIGTGRLLSDEAREAALPPDLFLREGESERPVPLRFERYIFGLALCSVPGFGGGNLLFSHDITSYMLSWATPILTLLPSVAVSIGLHMGVGVGAVRWYRRQPNQTRNGWTIDTQVLGATTGIFFTYFMITGLAISMEMAGGAALNNFGVQSEWVQNPHEFIRRGFRRSTKEPGVMNLRWVHPEAYIRNHANIANDLRQANSVDTGTYEGGENLKKRLPLNVSPSARQGLYTRCLHSPFVWLDTSLLQKRVELLTPARVQKGEQTPTHVVYSGDNETPVRGKEGIRQENTNILVGMFRYTGMWFSPLRDGQFFLERPGFATNPVREQDGSRPSDAYMLSLTGATTVPMLPAIFQEELSTEDIPKALLADWQKRAYTEVFEEYKKGIRETFGSAMLSPEQEDLVVRLADYKAHEQMRNWAHKFKNLPKKQKRIIIKSIIEFDSVQESYAKRMKTTLKRTPRSVLNQIFDEFNLSKKGVEVDDLTEMSALLTDTTPMRAIIDGKKAITPTPASNVPPSNVGVWRLGRKSSPSIAYQVRVDKEVDSEKEYPRMKHILVPRQTLWTQDELQKAKLGLSEFFSNGGKPPEPHSTRNEFFQDIDEDYPTLNDQRSVVELKTADVLEDEENQLVMTKAIDEPVEWSQVEESELRFQDKQYFLRLILQRMFHTPPYQYRQAQAEMQKKGTPQQDVLRRKLGRVKRIPTEEVGNIGL